MKRQARIVFLLDVDNTLLDNDRVTEDLKKFLERDFGKIGMQKYWDIFEELRSQLGYADYLSALQGYRLDYPGDPRILEISNFMLNYPFARRLYPGVLKLIRRLNSLGLAVILSDGDVVFQPYKVRRSGLFAAVAGRVLIYIHKERQLADIEERYPAPHYVFVDDKLRLLNAIKKAWGPRVATVFPRQGHYAHDPKILAAYPPADITIENIGELSQLLGKKSACPFLQG